MKNKTYFITLTPHQLFFFGGEQVEKADYYLKGNFIPQQTTLLGLIRYQVLLQNNLLNENIIINDIDAANWIGSKSFEYNKDNDFCKIKSISPCYLVKSDNGVQKKYLPYHQNFISGIKKLGNNYFLPNYDPKQYYPTTWKEVNCDNTFVETDCYVEVERIGIDKNYSGKTQNFSFFKQIWLKMNKGYSFGFYLTISKDVSLNNADITFGKESSPFFMNVQDIPIETLKSYDTPNALILISDAFVSDKFLSYSDFAICDTVSFRNIVNTTSGKHNFFGTHKSQVRLQLLKRGSVFIFQKDNLNHMKEDLDFNGNFQNIGYNHYQLIKIKL